MQSCEVTVARHLVEINQDPDRVDMVHWGGRVRVDLGCGVDTTRSGTASNKPSLSGTKTVPASGIRRLLVVRGKAGAAAVQTRCATLPERDR